MKSKVWSLGLVLLMAAGCSTWKHERPPGRPGRAPEWLHPGHAPHGRVARPTGMSAAAEKGTNVVKMTKVPNATEAGSFGMRWDAAKDPNTRGFIWFRSELGPMDEWFLSFNAMDFGTNAYSYAPCVTRGGQPPSGKYTPHIFARYQGEDAGDPAAQSFHARRERERKRLGKNAGNYAMSRDGSLLRLDTLKIIRR